MYLANRKHKTNNCYICGITLKQTDVTTPQGNSIRDGYCRKCRSEQQFIRTVRRMSLDEIDRKIANYKRLIKIYKEVRNEFYS